MPFSTTGVLAIGAEAAVSSLAAVRQNILDIYAALR
jgi:hypothetical protein